MKKFWIVLISLSIVGIVGDIFRFPFMNKFHQIFGGIASAFYIVFAILFIVGVGYEVFRKREGWEDSENKRK